MLHVGGGGGYCKRIQLRHSYLKGGGRSECEELLVVDDEVQCLGVKISEGGCGRDEAESRVIQGRNIEGALKIW